ncbi:MAG: endonuclease domain-containing protein [Candidatus Margulisbacteria bacterium]|nr:endonuclease domain-containing protein [Candidatus Margulisiibacteriota bacterium]
MTKIYNKKKYIDTRRRLRKNLTEAELLLWTVLKTQKPGVRFRRQYGVKAFVLDFYCPAHKLAIEVDGGIHQTDRQSAIDIDRQRIIENLGIRFLRFSNEQIKKNLTAVLKIIKENLTTKQVISP